MTDHQITLESSDKKTFKVDINIIQQSTTIKDVYENFCTMNEITVPLPNVDSIMLQKVIDWLTYHKDDTSSFDDDDIYDKKTLQISKWDQDFLPSDKNSLLQLLLAANYLAIPKLIDIICKTIADMLNGKTPEQIRQDFNLVDDFSKEEREALQKEYELPSPTNNL